MEFLIGQKENCAICGGSLPGMLSLVELSNHWHCLPKCSVYVCPDCHQKGMQRCPKCGAPLVFQHGKRVDGTMLH